MLFESFVQPKVNVNEWVIIEVFDGKELVRMEGLVSKIDKDYIWLKYPNKSEDPIKFSLKTSKLVKFN